MEGSLGSERRRVYRFEDYRVDSVKRVLTRGGETVPLTPKALSILLVLLANAGEVVEKSDLTRSVWSGQYISEGNLTQTICSLRKALGERANEARYVVTVPGRGYCFVAPVEASLDDSSASGVFPVMAAPAGPPLPAPRRRSRVRLGMGGALLVAASLVALSMHRGPGAPAPSGGPSLSAAQAAHRSAVAVLGFRNLSEGGAGAWLGPALAEMLTTELAAGPGARVTSGEDVARARQSLALAAVDQPDSAALGRLQDLLGADRVIVGTFVYTAGSPGGPRIRLDLRILQAPGGDTLTALSATGKEAELFDLVSRAGSDLRHALGLSDPSPARQQQARALLPGSPETARLYTAGLDRLRSSDPSGARDTLLEAVQADPGSAVIHSALSQAWSVLGSDARALDEARKAVELSAALPRVKRMEIEARLHEASRDWERADEIWRSLWTFFPEELEYGLRLASGLAAAGRGPEARDVIKTLRELPRPAGDDPRIDLAEAAVAKRVADPVTELRAAEAAAAKGRRAGETLTVAQALLYQGDALLLSGKAAESLPYFERAKALFTEAGDSMSVCRSLAHIGVALNEQSDLGGAEAKYREALALAERLGSQSGVAAQLGNLGLLAEDRGDLAQAQELLEQSYSQYLRLQDRAFAARALNALAEVLWRQGDLGGARERFEQVLAASRETGNRTDEARALSSLGLVLAHQGQLAEARRYHEEAFHLLRSTGDPGRAAGMLAASADAVARQGDLAGARRRYGYALTAKRRTGDRIGAAQILGSLADLAWAGGDLAAARSLSDQQLQTGEETGAQSLTAAALQIRGRCQMAAGDLAGARESLTRALTESRHRGELQNSVAVRLDLAALALAEGAFGDALAQARAAAAWYTARGIPAGAARAHALAAEALLALGRTAEARQSADLARAHAAESQDRWLSITLAAPLAHVDAAAGNSGRARRDLRSAVDEAVKIGHLPAALEARLVLAEMGDEMGAETEKGDPAALQALRRDATESGFLRIARQAAELQEKGMWMAGLTTRHR
jgi:DNA-binding winged helix-turn-helix (wHTH) protein/tetratricopeptide (TPR) repeat protein